MKYLLILIFFISVSVISNTNPLAARSFPEKGPYFWTAMKDGKTHHLLGTIHKAVDIEDLQCSEIITDRLQNSHLLFTEVNMDPSSLKAGVQKKLRSTPQRLNFKEEESAFWKSLTEQQKNILLEKYTEFLRQKSQNLTVEKIRETLKKLNRQQINYFLSASCLNTKAPSISQVEKFFLQSLDFQVYQLASQYSVDQTHLETFEEQIEIQKSLYQSGQDILHLSFTEEVLQEGSLKRIENFDEFCASIKNKREGVEQSIIKISKDYREGTLSMEHLMINMVHNILTLFYVPDTERQKFVEVYKENFYQKMLKERHDKWIPQIIQSHQEYDGLFIATGVAHFIGKYNILNLLETEGFEVKRFSPECQEE